MLSLLFSMIKQPIVDLPYNIASILLYGKNIVLVYTAKQKNYIEINIIFPVQNSIKTIQFFIRQ